jgi:hypothetical protein
VFTHRSRSGRHIYSLEDSDGRIGFQSFDKTVDRAVRESRVAHFQNFHVLVQFHSFEQPANDNDRRNSLVETAKGQIKSGGHLPAELIIAQVDVVEADFDELTIVVFQFFNRLLYIRRIGRLESQRFGHGTFGDAVPSESDFAFVEERRVVLILVHHRMESQNSCNESEKKTNKPNIVTLSR